MSALLKEPGVYTFEDNGTHWTVREDYGPFLEKNLLRGLENVLDSEACRKVKRNVYRTVYLYKPEERGEAGIYIKQYRTRRKWKDKLIARVYPSQAQREWRMMLEMRRRGLPVPEPLALGLRPSGESYLLSQEIALARPLREIFGPEKGPVLRALAALVYRLRREDIYYKDLQLDNILLRMEDAIPRLFLLDLHSARKGLSRGLWLKMLAKLVDSFGPIFNMEDKERFLRLYALEDPIFSSGLERNMERVMALAAGFGRAHLRSRTKRCLVESTSFAVEREGRRTLYFKRRFTKELVLGAVEAYKSAMGGLDAEAAMLKSTKKTSLTIVETPWGEVCVKHYKNPGLLDHLKGFLGLSRARRAWVIGNGLVTRAIPTSAPIALVEDRDESFLLSEPLNLPRIDYYILGHLNGFFTRLQEKKEFIRSFAQAIRSLHEKRIYHGDLKACNILVKELPQGGWEFYFIDYDRVAFDKEVFLRRRAKNLAQLHTSIPWCVTWADRMRFFRDYAQGTSLLDNKREFLGEVMRYSARRIPVGMEPFE